MKNQPTLQELKLLKEIEAGIKSGIALDFDLEKHLEILKSKSISIQKAGDDLTRKEH